MHCATCYQLRSRQRGIALLLVISAVAVASILGLAILSSAAMRAATNATACRAAEAQYLAESGANLAMYYMQNPADAPSLSNGVYSGGTGLDFECLIPGVVDLAIARSDSDTSIYNIASTAHVGNRANDRLTRKLNVSVRINSTYKVTSALASIGDFTMPSTMTISGDVRCDGTFAQMPSNGSTSMLNGTIHASGSNVSGWLPNPSFPSAACPTVQQLTLLTTIGGAIPYYSYLDDAGVQHAGTPQLISGVITGTLTPAASNPKAIYYATDNLSLGQCAIDGSIVLTGANTKLTVTDAAHITARSGMPALIVPDSVLFRSDTASKSLNVDGVCWIGNGISTTGNAPSTSSMVVNGALLFGGTTPVIGEFVGAISVTFDASKASAPLLSDVDRTPHSISIVQWGI